MCQWLHQILYKESCGVVSLLIQCVVFVEDNDFVVVVGRSFVVVEMGLIVVVIVVESFVMVDDGKSVLRVNDCCGLRYGV